MAGTIKGQLNEFNINSEWFSLFSTTRSLCDYLVFERMLTDLEGKTYWDIVIFRQIYRFSFNYDYIFKLRS